jgi:Ca2+/Na+ antiporter
MILSLVFYLLVTYQITKKDIGKQVDLLIENTSQNQPQMEINLIDLLMEDGPKKQSKLELNRVALMIEDTSQNQPRMEINLIDLLMEDGPKKQSKLELNRVASMIEDTSQNQLRERIRYVTLALLGFSGVTLSSYVIIQSIIFLSSQLNMSEYIISFFMVSIGTSLPELSVDVTAIKHKHYRIAMGDLIGSCIVDSTLAIGIGQFLFPQAISTVTAVPSIIYALFASLIVILIAAKREKIDKKAGIVFILLYLFSFPSIILIENYLFF